MTDTVKRTAELREMLRGRRREMHVEVRSRLRTERSGRPLEVRDQLDHSDANSQSDLDLTLLQMRTETVSLIDDAIARLDAGQYGACVECGREIAARRLGALPFAVRCQPCAERRESDHQDLRVSTARRATASPFARIAEP